MRHVGYNHLISNMLQWNRRLPPSRLFWFWKGRACSTSVNQNGGCYTHQNLNGSWFSLARIHRAVLSQDDSYVLFLNNRLLFSNKTWDTSYLLRESSPCFCSYPILHWFASRATHAIFHALGENYHALYTNVRITPYRPHGNNCFRPI